MTHATQVFRKNKCRAGLTLLPRSRIEGPFFTVVLPTDGSLEGGMKTEAAIPLSAKSGLRLESVVPCCDSPLAIRGIC